MATVREQIQNSDNAICQNIEVLTEQRELLSQNILAQLRNLVESIAVLIHSGNPNNIFNYAAIEPAISYAKSQAHFNILGRLHKLIQISASHYTFDGDDSERLMLKYYEYLIRIKGLVNTYYGITILRNLDKFPVDLDPSLREYHEKIAESIRVTKETSTTNTTVARYYIHKTRPFFIDGDIFYEVTFYRAVNKVSKFDRIIAFTDIDINDKYASLLMLQQNSIDVLEQAMPITVIRNWKVSIRPCELKNYARLLGIDIRVRTDSQEYQILMDWLTQYSANLLDIVDMPTNSYNWLKTVCTQNQPSKQHIFIMLDKARTIIHNFKEGSSVLRYLLLRMYNQSLKVQYDPRDCKYLSNLKLSYGCIPFDTMPFCTSLPGHNPKYWDLVESLNTEKRDHELLARRVKNNVELHGILYTNIKEIEEFGDINTLIAKHNSMLYHAHKNRQLIQDKGHVFIRGYENDTVAIVEKLQEFSKLQIEGYTHAVERWLNDTSMVIDDNVKKDALKSLFSKSRVGLIYGAAGTGKSTMLNHIANYFNDKDKLFLAHTNPAKDNLQRKVTANKSTFRTISSEINRRISDTEYDLLVIDECSTVSNSDFLKVLNKTSFKLLVLVGDIYQIESIQFGNWFSIIRSFIPNTSVYELTTPFRTTNTSLLNFWNKLRAIEDDITEVMVQNGYPSVLDKTLFETHEQDEIILCLNYDGLYGINNINRFLQNNNPEKETTWQESTYKIGDPVLFHDSERFRPVIYNNLKGWIIDIACEPGWIQFDIELDTSVSEFDVNNSELEWIKDSIVRFRVYDTNINENGHDASDDDDDSLNITVPFQVAYAVSIHKAQGLEFDSVKVVVTDANEDDISHSILYTAVTRARNHLKIFWTPETQQKIIKQLSITGDSKDPYLLSSRRNLIQS